MDMADFMHKHHLTDEDLDRMAEPYERGDYPHEDGQIMIGSHLDAVSKSNDLKSTPDDLWRESLS